MTDPQAVEQAAQPMFEKFPQIGGYAPAELDAIVAFRVTSDVVSVLDYRKGFGHSDLAKLAPLKQSGHADLSEIGA